MRLFRLATRRTLINILSCKSCSCCTHNDLSPAVLGFCADVLQMIKQSSGTFFFNTQTHVYSVRSVRSAGEQATYTIHVSKGCVVVARCPHASNDWATGRHNEMHIVWPKIGARVMLILCASSWVSHKRTAHTCRFETNSKALSACGPNMLLIPLCLSQQRICREENAICF